MARGTMHAKKTNGANRNATFATMNLKADGKVRGPELSALTGRDDWDADVLVWYETWRTSPQAQIFEATDWSRLGLLARIVERYFISPSGAAMSEIRLNEERLGATVVDRMRARMTITHEDGTGPDATVLSIVSGDGEESDEDILAGL